MRIKQLEIKGFKSFKNRTVLRFKKGISGIAGPNGCGKSNIVDAFLWVMGETAPGHLRGASMEDVIFNGTDTKPSSGVAEVSLVIEKSDKAYLPAPYQQLSEIMVTRRLDRDGRSEYLINSQLCRLKDVQDVFMDTGVGLHGFSFIEQGAVERFLSSKPEQKRALIESVAGISKFRIRKKSAERKLELTKHNMSRLQDKLSQQEQQLKKLQKQSQKAEQFRTLKKQIQEVDIQVSQYDLQSIQGEIHKLDSQIKKGQSEKQKIQQQIKQLQKSVDDTSIHQKKAQLQKTQADVHSIQQKLSSVEKELAGLQASLKMSVETDHQLKEDVQFSQDHHQELLNQLESNQNQLKQLENKYKLNQEKLQNLKKDWDHLEKCYLAEEDKKISIEKELMEYQKEGIKVREQVQVLSEKLEFLEIRDKEWNKLIEKKQAELKKIISAKQELTESLKSTTSKYSHLLATIQGKSQQSSDLKQLVKDQEAQVHGACQQLTVLYTKWQGWINMDSPEEMTSAKQQEILSQIVHLIKTSNHELQKLTRLLEKIEQSLTQLQQAFPTHQKQAHDQGEIDKVQRHILEMNKDHESLLRDHARLTEEIDLFQQKVKECEENKKQLQIKLANMQNKTSLPQLTNLEKSLQVVTEKLRKWVRDKEHVSVQREELEKTQLLYEKEKLVLNEKNKYLNQSLEKEKRREKNVHSQLEQKKTLLSHYDLRAKKLQDRQKILTQQLSHKTANITQQTKECSALESQTSQAQADIVKWHQVISEKETEISTAQLKQADWLSQKQALLSKMKERYQLESVDNFTDPESDESFIYEEELKKLQNMKQELSRIGEVNLLALKEYDELVKEKEFYQGQYDDLYSAKKQLTQVISRMDRFCSKKFKTVFEKVNLSFSSVFPVLFEGGKAELALVPDDGVDIFIQPPGKKIQNINLLSGGEKAMVAVAFMFSLFLAKPSPFCILDEVDAPLDDINIGRFCSLLTEMSNCSQVIIITHNTHTMKSCHQLYGVTMEEKGISKVLSLDMKSTIQQKSLIF